MEIKVKYIKTPAVEIKVKRAAAGKKGGSAKVPKGFAMMDKEKLKAASKKGLEKRWGKK